MGEDEKEFIDSLIEQTHEVMRHNGVVPVDAVGQLDPSIENVVGTCGADDSHPASAVVKVVRKGFLIGDRVLRPADVIVAK